MEMGRGFFLIALAIPSFVGCAGPDYPPAAYPPRYVEDFAGAEIPYRVTATASDRRVWVHLSAGTCRRFVVTPAAPPHFAAEFQCPHPRSNVDVGIWLPGQPPWRARTNPAGDVIFAVPDKTAVGIRPEAVARLFIGRYSAGEVTLQPLIFAALDRIPSEPAPSPLLLTPPIELPAPSPPVVESPQPSRPNEARRQLTDGELLLFTGAVCLVKVKLVETCEEKMGTAACSAASQYLTTGQVDPKEVAKDVVVSKAIEDDDFAKNVAKAVEFAGCFLDTLPKVTQLTATRGN
jgi:hypothetical protein